MGVFAQLASWVKESSARRLSRRAPIVGSLRLDNQFTRIGGSLTPLAITSILREADTGYIHRLIDLANESRQKDCHLQALLGTREGTLSGLSWKVIPALEQGEQVASDQAKEIAAFVEAALRGAEGRGGETRNFTDLISHLSSAPYYGFAVSETEWRVDKGQLVPDGFRPIAHRRFRFSQSQGDLRWWDDVSPTSLEGISLMRAYPDKFIQHQPRINGDVTSREGLCRVLLWFAMFRNYATTDWLRLAEMAWKPWRLGKYNEDASTEEIADLEEALELLTNNGVATFSSRADIQVEWPMRGRGEQSQHPVMLRFFGQEMSKAVLGQTLTVESGERGARSLGEVHDRVRKDILENDALTLAATVRRDLIEPIVRLNFGAAAAVPWFIFITDDVADIGNYARAIMSLVQAGAELPQAWVRDKVGAPNPEPGEPILRGQKALEPQPPESQEPENDEVEVEVDEAA